MMEILRNPVAVVSIIVSLILLSAPLIPIQVTETYFTSEPFSYERTGPPRLVYKTILFVFRVTEAHQSIKNTDTRIGTFNLNFVFDNGIEKESITKSVDLLPGEEKEVIANVRVSGQVNVEVNVIPPNKFVPEEKVVEKKVNAWSFIGSMINPFD